MLNLYKYYDKPDVLIQRESMVFIEDVIEKTKDIIRYYADRNRDDDPSFPDITISNTIEQSPGLFTMRVRSSHTTRARVIVFVDKNNHIYASGSDMNLQKVTDHENEDGIDDDELTDIVYGILDSLVGR